MAKNRKKIAICTPSHTLSGNIFASKARTYRQSEKTCQTAIFPPKCPHNTVNFGPPAAEIGSLVCGTSANFNRFRVFASLLQRRRSTEANQTLQGVWPSPGLLHYIYIFGGSCPVTEFCQVQTSLRPSLALSYIGNVTARHWSSRRQLNFAALSRRRHLYSAGRPSRWASVHILVCSRLVTFRACRDVPYIPLHTSPKTALRGSSSCAVSCECDSILNF